MKKTAILVDGAFYNKRAQYLFGSKSPKERADELITYCMRHLSKNERKSELYRIFYYDCMPLDKKVFHPFTGRTVDLGKTDQKKWMEEFFVELAAKRKVAIRRGELLESSANYTLKQDVVKKLFRGDIKFEEIKESDFYLDVKQKGVDMKIGLDISSLAYKRQVDQIILIAGDSDFVPAAKHARREGIDFILDPMWHTIKESLNEHIDGLRSCTPKKDEGKEPLRIK